MSAKYEFIDAQKAQYAIVKMCRWLGVSTSGFYEWRDRPASATARRRERLAALIQWIYDDSDGTYGHRRVHAALVRQGERCSPELVRAIMRELGLVPCQPRPFRPATTVAGGAAPAPDLNRKDFRKHKTDNKLVSDITYIRTGEGWLYLAVVIDLATRHVIGWSMRQSLDRELVLQAVLMALWQRPGTDPVILHSDRGTQYTSHEYQAFLKDHGIVSSMSGVGSCYDNAVAESFFGLLKRERVNRRNYPTRAVARADVFDYIERFYNRQRGHSYTGGLPPACYAAQRSGNLN